jgi:uncharacterized protein YjgD (DUF1641 family)
MSTDLVAAGTPATIDERLDRLSAQVEEIAADLRSQRESRQQWEELAQTLVPVSRSAFDLASRELAEAERNGYFAVARGGRTVMDRVVAAYAEEDFDALGDNLVQLLGIAKELAGPEMTGLLDRTLVTLREGESQHLDPPSTFGLLKQLRDPQTRRGLARALALVQTIGAEPTSHPPASRTT